MLTVANETLDAIDKGCGILLLSRHYSQEFNVETYANCKANTWQTEAYAGHS